MKTTDTGKAEDFRLLFDRVARRPSHQTHKNFLLGLTDFQIYLANAQKEFGFRFTDVTLDNFLTGWILEFERLYNEKKWSQREIEDKTRAWADLELAKLGMQEKDPETYEAINTFMDFLGKEKRRNCSITAPSGKVYQGFKMYDPANPIKLDTANKSKEEIQLSKELIERAMNVLDHDDPTNVYDFKLLEYTKNFCITAGNNKIEQFQNRAETFRRRMDLIETSKKYRFGDSFLPLIVHHNKNEFGFRHMPRDNMWIEVGLKFDNIFVSGMHLAKVYVDTNESGFGVKNTRFYDEIIPNSFKQVGVSVFVVGIENDNTQFYYHFILEQTDIELSKMKSRYAYACPHCVQPMKTLEKNLVCCERESCVKAFQDNVSIVYDLNNKEVKDQMRLFEMKSIWKTEDKLRQFATNLLDFLTNKRVQIIDNYTEADLKERNEKRAKRGKSPLFPVSIIRVDGTLKEYVSFISRKFNGNYKLARVETPVDGHFFRFKKRSKWSRLYAWIKSCKTDEQIVKRLEQLKRVDEDGNPLPDEEQYEWDSFYKHIKVWKLPFWRFKGEGNPRPRIDVIKVGDKI